MNRVILAICLCALVTSKVLDKFWKGEFERLRGKFLKKAVMSRADLKLAQKNAAYNRIDLREQVSNEKQVQAEMMTAFVKGILEHEAYKDFVFDSYLGGGAYGIVYGGRLEDGSGDRVSLKVMMDSDASFPDTNKAWENYQILEAAEIPFIIKTEEPHCESLDFPPTHLCGVLMEEAFQADAPMFTPTKNADQKKKNTELIFGFFVRLLEGYAKMHTVAKCYHGDVKPPNVMWKKVGKVYEPRIIDFDLTFKMVTSDTNPPGLIYTQTYRPPEISRIIPNDILTNEQWFEWSVYHFDGQFREESWVIGKTIDEILEINQEELDTNSALIAALQDITGQMKTPKIKERISTENAWKLALEKHEKIVRIRRIVV